MDNFLQNPDLQNIYQIAILILVLGLVWVVLRTVLKLATRILFTGCALIFILGIVLVAVRVLGG